MSHDPGMATAPWARALAFHTTLPDGGRVRIRPVTPADKGRIAAALERMTARTRFLRFGSERQQLSLAELRYLTELDYDTHVAWGAIAVDEPGQPGVAVARFVRNPDQPSEAEFAITIVDAWQGRGLGRVMMQTLMLSAAERDVETLVGYVLPENRDALHLFTSLGGQTCVFDDEMVVVEIPVGRARRRAHQSGKVLPRLRAVLGVR